MIFGAGKSASIHEIIRGDEVADELSLNIRMSAALGVYALAPVGKQQTIDWGTIGQGGGIQIIGTSEETVSFGDIVYPGFVYLENLDDTNYIEFGPDSTGMVTLGRLLPGEQCVLRLAPTGVTLIAQANTASCKMRVVCLEAGT